MTPEQFMANFGAIAEAPGGILELRQLVLSLAVSGRLVSQEPGSGTHVVELASREIAERIAAGETRKRKSAAHVTDMPPFDLPKTWAWTRGEDVFWFITSGSRGWAKYYSHEGPLFLRVGNLDYMSTQLDLASTQRVSPPDGKETLRTRVLPRDILISITGDPGMVAVVPDKLGAAHISQHVAIARPCKDLSAKYLGIYLTSPVALEQFFGAQRGIKNSLGLDDIRRLYVPIPPLAEQKRIVERVDALMSMLDDLEQRQEKKRSAAIHVSKASLDALVEAEDPDQLARAWERVSKNFGVVAGAEMMRAVVVSLGLRGSLTSRVNKGPSVEESLSAIAAHQEKIGLKKKKRDLGPSAQRWVDEHRIPRGWHWVSLGDVFVSLKYGTSKKCRSDITGTPVLRIPNVPGGVVDLSELKFADFSEREHEQWSLHAGDMLVIRSNGSVTLVGQPAIVPPSAEHCLYAGYLVRIRFLLNHSLPEFLFLALRSSNVRRQIEAPISPTSSVKNINSTKIANLRIPLPPVAEQRCIVEKVDSLMALIDQLEDRSTRLQQAASKLATAATRAS